MMRKLTASRRKTTTTSPLSDLVIDQIKSRDDLTEAIQSGGLLLAQVRQRRNNRAKAIRKHFVELKGGLSD